MGSLFPEHLSTKSGEECVYKCECGFSLGTNLPTIQIGIFPFQWNCDIFILQSLRILWLSMGAARIPCWLVALTALTVLWSLI